MRSFCREQYSAIAAALTAGALAATVIHAQAPAPAFRIEEATIAQIHAAFRDGSLTCRALVEQYLKRIDAYDKNGPALNAFRFAIGWTWWRVLRRRSQCHRITARRLRALVARWLPTPRICHPYPLVRLGVVTQGGSRMR